MRNILNDKAIHNAFVIDMAMGGSSNTVLHLLSIAKEAEVDFDITKINEISEKVAHIAKISPSLSTVHMDDINRAGGVNAVMREVSRRGGVLELDAMTVTGETLGERIKDAVILHFIASEVTFIGIEPPGVELALNGYAANTTMGTEDGLILTTES